MGRNILKGKRFVIITWIVFLVLVTFVDKNNLLDSWRLRGEIKALEEQRDFYLQKIEEDSIVLQNLQDNAFLERYAREYFFMKRENEVIYIIR